ncbi:M20/M25/M40 family metallo-hydrolase [Oligoflexaceae bacterium]|nr:M20/M25/M40 family metallo-hydrolase [Oligoflexaceae bacterium]
MQIKLLFFFLGFLFSCGLGSKSSNSVVMVSSNPSLESMLKLEPKFLGKKNGKLLLQSPTLSELEWLSLNAHSPGQMCGAMQYRKLTDDIVTPDPLILPLYAPYYKLSAVDDMVQSVDESNAVATVEAMVAKMTRHHNEATGQETTTFIREQIEAAKQSLDVTIEEIDHSDYLAGMKQKSLVVRLAGDTEETLVFGAHMDSIFRSRFETDQSIAPGADDDASGVATLLEIFRVIADRNLSFTRAIEFHFYAAEEIGLIGSGDIAQVYREQGRKIGAMVQFDMTGYSPDGSSQTIYFPDNDTSINLRRFGKDLLNTYLDGDFGEGTIVGGTSDHASFAAEGFETLFPFEHPVNFNKNLHTAEDTLANLNNPKQMVRFSAFGLAYAAHFAGLTSAKDEFAAAAKEASPVDLSDELFVAVVQDEVQGYQFSVSVPDSAESVEVCLTEQSQSQGCQFHLLDLEAAGEKNGRRLFTGLWPDLQSGSSVRIIAYDESDRWSAARNVTVKSK